jgi:hypothetical protein
MKAMKFFILHDLHVLLVDFNLVLAWSGRPIKIVVLAPPNHAEHLHVIPLLQDVTGFHLLAVDGGGDRLFDLKLLDQVVDGGALGQGQGCFAFGCAG